MNKLDKIVSELEPDEECGDASTTGWYGRIDWAPTDDGVGSTADDIIEACNNVAKDIGEDPLDAEEEQEIRDHVGVIVFVNDHGTRDVTWFDDDDKLFDTWDDVQHDVNQPYCPGCGDAIDGIDEYPQDTRCGNCGAEPDEDHKHGCDREPVQEVRGDENWWHRACAEKEGVDFRKEPDEPEGPTSYFDDEPARKNPSGTPYFDED